MRAVSTFYDHIRAVAEQEGVTVAEAMQRARELGITALEVSSFNLKDRVSEVKEELAAGGLAVASVPIFMDLGRNNDVRSQCEPYFETTRELGADRVLVIPGFFAPEDGEAECARAVERMKDGVNRVAEIATHYNISLIMEDFDNILSPVNSAEGLRSFLDACPVGDPDVLCRLLFRSGHGDGTLSGGIRIRDFVSEAADSNGGAGLQGGRLGRTRRVCGGRGCAGGSCTRCDRIAGSCARSR